MHRMIASALVALALVTTAAAATPEKAAPKTETPAERRERAAKAAKMRKETAPGQLDPTRAMLRQREMFRTTVEICERPDACDKVLLADTEANYVKACERCAKSPDICETDRQAIRDGTSKRRFNPCE